MFSAVHTLASRGYVKMDSQPGPNNRLIIVLVFAGGGGGGDWSIFRCTPERLHLICGVSALAGSDLVDYVITKIDKPAK